MISRRYIRIKALQTVYAIEQSEGNTEGAVYKCQQIFDQKIEQSANLFIVGILYLIETAKYAHINAEMRKSKLLPSKEDLNASSKLAFNLWNERILNSKSFGQRVKDHHLMNSIDETWIKKLFKQIEATEEYAHYIAKEEHVILEDEKFMQWMWNDVFMKNEDFVAYLNDDVEGWEDDYPLIQMLMDNLFGHKGKISFSKILSADKTDYAHTLIKAVLEKNDYLMTLIKPKLQNWDAERVALIDSILLRMGVAEFLYFPTIPTKVTINECIEIAKAYSTPQSGVFVNGVLDSIHILLKNEGKINKA